MNTIKSDYYNKYDINWLINEVDSGVNHTYVAFWQAEEDFDYNCFSQWYASPFVVNGRKYLTAEQYMMSEKALLFSDIEIYKAIMNEPSPKKCQELGKQVSNFDSSIWDASAREIVFHGNVAKFQSDISLFSRLLGTGNSVLIEASPKDDNYGSGIKKEDLLNRDGTLKVHPKDWHKEGSSKQAENKLGFILMGVRDLLLDYMKSNPDAPIIEEMLKSAMKIDEKGFINIYGDYQSH